MSDGRPCDMSFCLYSTCMSSTVMHSSVFECCVIFLVYVSYVTLKIAFPNTKALQSVTNDTVEGLNCKVVQMLYERPKICNKKQVP